MKHTYIFKLEDGLLTEDDLYRLNKVAMHGPTSCRSKSDGLNFTEVQIFAEPGDVHRLAHAANFSRRQLVDAILKARRRGDTMISDATKRLNALRKRSVKKTLEHNRPVKADDFYEPPSVMVQAQRLAKAGCEIRFQRMSTGDYEVIIFGESFIFANAVHAFEFLRGVEKGFTSAPLWKCVSEVRITRRSKRSC